MYEKFEKCDVACRWISPVTNCHTFSRATGWWSLQ